MLKNPYITPPTPPPKKKNILYPNSLLLKWLKTLNFQVVREDFIQGKTLLPIVPYQFYRVKSENPQLQGSKIPKHRGAALRMASLASLPENVASR